MVVCILFYSAKISNHTHQIETMLEIEINCHYLYRSPDNSTSVLCVPRARRCAYDVIRDLLFKYFTPKLGIETWYK